MIYNIIKATREYLPIFLAYMKNTSIASEHLTKIIKLTHPDISSKIKHFSFIRIDKTNTVSAIMPNPLYGIKYMKSGLWKSDMCFNYNNTSPIYNREKYFTTPEYKLKYQNFMTKISAVTSICLNYKLGNYKDTFSFLFTSNVSENEIEELFLTLHMICVSFYTAKIKFRTQIKGPSSLYKHYIHNSDQYDFDPFRKFIEKNKITKNQEIYLLPLALNIPMISISEILHKSIRTVEKTVNDLKIILDLDTKNELNYVLHNFYIKEVKLWLKNNN